MHGLLERRFGVLVESLDGNDALRREVLLHPWEKRLEHPWFLEELQDVPSKYHVERPNFTGRTEILDPHPSYGDRLILQIGNLSIDRHNPSPAFHEHFGKSSLPSTKIEDAIP